MDNINSTILEYLQKQEERLKNLENLLSLSKNILNVNEVSLLTGLSTSTLYKLTHRGKIPFYKQSSYLFFDKIEIENWLKENRGYNAEEIKNQASTYVTLNNAGQA